MTQQQGVQNQSFLLAPLSWEPSGRRRGVRSAVEQAQHASAHEKAWLTIPFEATGCKGAGHRQVTTKMGLIVRSEPRGGRARWTRSYARAEAHLYPLIGPPLFNQRPSGESRYQDNMVRRENYRPFLMNNQLIKTTPVILKQLPEPAKIRIDFFFFFRSVFLCISLFGMEETASVSYTQI